jgi:predicted metal-dependent hydrolase
MNSQRDEACAVLETAAAFGLDDKQLVDAVVCAWDCAGIDAEALEHLTATLAERILEHERSGTR